MATLYKKKQRGRNVKYGMCVWRVGYTGNARGEVVVLYMKDVFGERGLYTDVLGGSMVG